MAISDRILSWAGLERRNGAADASWQNLVAGGVSAVSPRAAEQVAAVHACVDVIASALASLPPYIRRRDTGERVAHALDSRLRKPNRWQTWADFVQWYIAQALLYGNALAIIENDGELTPVEWHSVSLNQTASGNITYGAQPSSIAAGRTADYRNVAAAQVLHLRDRSDDGLVGRARLQRSGRAVQHAADLADAAAAVWQNGIMPTGALTLQGRLTPEQRELLGAQVRQEYAGATNHGRILLLDQGASWQALSATPEDAEMLGARAFSVIEICRLFEVPPPILQDYSNNTFTNASIAGKWFAQFTLASWARKFELVFSDALLESDLELELDMGGFVRGDLGERWNAYNIALTHGVLTPQEVKALEGW